jgi:hypothetical protein
MNLSRLALLASCIIVAPAEAAPAKAPIQIINEAGVPAQQVDALTQELGMWTPRVYAYLHSHDTSPIKLVLTRHAGPGLHIDDKILISPDDHELLETWIHELAHHVTGHDSSFFFKEGIATHTLEALFAQDHRVPMGWPQYGQSNDAWVNLFLLRGQMQSLPDAMNWEEYQGFPPEKDFRSWQIYCIAGSFVGWLIRTEGYGAFRRAFTEEKLDEHGAELEQAWLNYIRHQNLAAFDPMDYLPDGWRYRGFAQRLKSP